MSNLDYNPIRTLLQDNDIDFSTFDKSLVEKFNFLYENHINNNFDNFFDVSHDILKMILDFYQSPDFQIYPLDNTDGIYYSNWNYIRPLDILTDGFKYSFGKFNDASRYCPIYFKFYETNPNERSFYLGRHPFVSGHELLKKLYPYWPENSIVILVNVNFIDNTDEFNNVQLQGTIAHEIECT